MAPTESSAVMIIAVITGSSILLIMRWARETWWDYPLPRLRCRRGGDAVAHARRGGDQIDAEFALQPLLRNLHVQQAQKAAAETESQRYGVFRLVEKRRVVELQLAQRVAQRLVFVGLHQNRPAKTIGLMASLPSEAGAGVAASMMVSPTRASATLLDVGDHEALSPAASSSSATGFGVSAPKYSTS